MKIKLIKIKDYYLPARAHYNDAGADVMSPIQEVIGPYETKKIPLGFGLEVPDGHMACIFPKSGLTSEGIIAHVPPVDSGYRGEIHAVITNTSYKDFYIARGHKIGQLVIVPIILAEFTEALDNSRGTGSFGSTGK